MPSTRRPATGPIGGRGVALVVEDDATMASLWQRVLERRGWVVEHAGSVLCALTTLSRQADRLGLAIIDDRLPGGDGLGLLPLLRGLRTAPMFALVSAYGDAARWTAAARAGFSLVHKPSSEQECDDLLDLLEMRRDEESASTRATRPLSRRVKRVPPLVLRDDGVETPENDLALRPTERVILAGLLARAGQPVSTTEIGSWIERHDPGARRVVHKHVANLRKRLGPYRDAVETVRGAGYRLVPGWFWRG